MESSILSEVDDTSILRTGLSTCYWCPLDWLRPLGSCPRAAGWSAANLCIGTLLPGHDPVACPLAAKADHYPHWQGRCRGSLSICGRVSGAAQGSRVAAEWQRSAFQKRFFQIVCEDSVLFKSCACARYTVLEP